METASTPKEARRVLKWQHDVARSVSYSEPDYYAAACPRRPQPPLPTTYRRADSFPTVRSERLPLRLVRRDTVTTERYARDAYVRPGSGAILSSKTRFESPERRDHLPPPPMGRRASHGDQASFYGQGHYGERIIERVPARSNISSRDSPPRSRYVAQYTVAAPPRRSHDSSRVEAATSIGRRSDRHSEHGSRGRSRSEVSSSRYHGPGLSLHSVRARSPPVSRISHSPRSHGRSDDRSASLVRPMHGRPRAESFTAPRSHRSDSTPTPSVHYIPSPASRTSTTTIRVVPKGERRDLDWVDGRSTSHVPFPRSMVSGHVYAESVTPSDSVSSAGSKRERERLVGRMRW